MIAHGGASCCMSYVARRTNMQAEIWRQRQNAPSKIDMTRNQKNDTITQPTGPQTYADKDMIG